MSKQLEKKSLLNKSTVSSSNPVKEDEKNHNHNKDEVSQFNPLDDQDLTQNNISLFNDFPQFEEENKSPFQVQEGYGYKFKKLDKKMT